MFGWVTCSFPFCIYVLIVTEQLKTLSCWGFNYFSKVYRVYTVALCVSTSLSCFSEPSLVYQILNWLKIFNSRPLPINSTIIECVCFNKNNCALCSLSIRSFNVDSTTETQRLVNNTTLLDAETCYDINVFFSFSALVWHCWLQLAWHKMAWVNFSFKACYMSL